MKKRTGKKQNWDLLPGVLLLIFLPLITFAKLVETDFAKYDWFPDIASQYDFFAYWKSRVFFVLTVWMLLILLDRCLLRRKKLTGWKMFFPLFLYGGLAAVSALFSIDVRLSTYGMLEQFETVWVLLGYVAAAFYFFQVTESCQDAQIFLTSLAVGACFQGLLGLSQLLGHDFWRSQPGIWLLTLGYGKDLMEGLQVRDTGVGTVYMSLLNPNYAGVYLVLTIPPIFALSFCMKKTWQKIGVFVLTLLLVISLAGSGSKTGFLIFAILVGLSILLYGKRKKGQWIRMTAFVLAFGTFMAGYDAISGHALGKAAKNIRRVNAYPLEDISPEKDFVRICFQGRELKLDAEKVSEGIVLWVWEGEEDLPLVWKEDEGFLLEDPVFQKIRFDVALSGGDVWILMDYYGTTWHFKKTKQGYVYVNQYGKEDEIVDAPAVLKGYERMFTGRGYLFGRTIPLLKDTLLKGTGPDTFVLAFPQKDYRMRANTGWKILAEIPSKAHNMYLQSAVQTGVLSLACLLIFWISYLVQGFRLYHGFGSMGSGETQDPGIYMGAGILTGVLGYLLMGMLNDSVVAVAPVFWALCGIGGALGRIQKTK